MHSDSAASNTAVLRMLGANMKTARIRNSITRTKMSGLLGVSIVHLEQMERGEIDFELLTLLKIANILAVDPSVLMQDHKAVVMRSIFGGAG